jgi:hypothetical protein
MMAMAIRGARAEGRIGAAAALAALRLDFLICPNIPCLGSNGYFGTMSSFEAASRPKTAMAFAEVPTLRLCSEFVTFFEVAKNRCCKQSGYDDQIVENSKKSQTLRAGFPAKEARNGAPSYFRDGGVKSLNREGTKNHEGFWRQRYVG